MKYSTQIRPGETLPQARMRVRAELQRLTALQDAWAIDTITYEERDLEVTGTITKRAPSAQRPKKKRGRKPSAKCGTYGGYARHKREETVVCAPCKHANRVKSLAHYHRRRAREQAVS